MKKKQRSLVLVEDFWCSSVLVGERSRGGSSGSGKGAVFLWFTALVSIDDCCDETVYCLVRSHVVIICLWLCGGCPINISLFVVVFGGLVAM